MRGGVRPIRPARLRRPNCGGASSAPKRIEMYHAGCDRSPRAGGGTWRFIRRSRSREAGPACGVLPERPRGTTRQIRKNPSRTTSRRSASAAGPELTLRSYHRCPAPARWRRAFSVGRGCPATLVEVLARGSSATGPEVPRPERRVVGPTADVDLRAACLPHASIFPSRRLTVCTDPAWFGGFFFFFFFGRPTRRSAGPRPRSVESMKTVKALHGAAPLLRASVFHRAAPSLDG